MNGITIKYRKSDFERGGGNSVCIDLFKNGECAGKVDAIHSKTFIYWNKYYDIEDEKISENSKSLHVIGISILEEHRRKGIGELLYKRIENYAKENEYEYVTLGSITDALGFWKKMGFKVYSMGNYFNMYKKI